MVARLVGVARRLAAARHAVTRTLSSPTARTHTTPNVAASQTLTRRTVARPLAGLTPVMNPLDLPTLLPLDLRPVVTPLLEALRPVDPHPMATNMSLSVWGRHVDPKQNHTLE